CEVAVNLDRLLTRGHHLDLIAGLVESDLGKEVLLLLKCVSDEGGNLWALIGHRKSPFALFVSLAAPLMDSVKREPRDQVERGASNAAFRVALRWRPFNSANADRTNNAAFAKNEERSLLFFQKGPRDLQVRVLLHVSRSGLANQHCVIRLGLCPIAG